ncbi:tRNA dihydrouridine synthase DusB [Steroidobacter sp.]|uniref:tRNA dihydrouridine synthase DusB n=1 Tax=Steroidobacter sp. TaxID=1978227 RepID=UPI001A531C32|nr:tRNA dihydrouridine synthase DusB [Steroidobacter sp.]MBL8268679.1 tRNA dihydrouridine synthase DusB [Steroidobacter sp.]
MRIGPYELVNNLALAPMAGVTDLPFRLLCRRMGAAIAAGEMLTCDVRLWHTEKSRRRMDHSGEPEPRVVQIAGGDPEMMAEAARRNADAGAQIIDINLGCPAKKVCNKAAGSALMKDEPLVRQILEAVVKAVSVPVTLKMRTGWDPEHRNGPAIARMAEAIGVQALAIHGRTRACMYQGSAEYDTIRSIKQSVSIPIFANGDIDSAAKAKHVLEQTGVDGLMIGRSAQGQPWIFREILAGLNDGAHDAHSYAPPSIAEVRDIMLAHLRDLHAFYGEEAGVRVARKHIDWYAKSRASAPALRQAVMQATDASTQIDRVQAYFNALAEAPEERLSSAA